MAILSRNLSSQLNTCLPVLCLFLRGAGLTTWNLKTASSPHPSGFKHLQMLELGVTPARIAIPIVPPSTSADSCALSTPNGLSSRWRLSSSSFQYNRSEWADSMTLKVHQDQPSTIADLVLLLTSRYPAAPT